MNLHYTLMIKPKYLYFPLPCICIHLYLLLCYWGNGCLYWRLNSSPHFSQALHTLFNCTIKLFLCLTLPISSKHICLYYSRRILLVSYFPQDITFFIFDYRTDIKSMLVPAVSTTSHHIHSSFHSGLGYLSLTLPLKIIYLKMTNEVYVVKKVIFSFLIFSLSHKIQWSTHTLLEI